MYAKALNNSMVAAMKYSCVETINPLCPTQIAVKEKYSPTVACINTQEQLLTKCPYNNHTLSSCSKLDTKEPLDTFNNNINPIIAPTKHMQQDIAEGSKMTTVTN